MATNENINYSKLVLIVMKICTEVKRALLLKRIRELTPSHFPNPWTLDDFLNARIQDVMKGKEGSNKAHIYYPGHRKETNLHEWDLQMICFILTLAYERQTRSRHDVENLKHLRNNLCHLPEPILSDDEYSKYMEGIEESLKNDFLYLQDDAFEERLMSELEDIKHGRMSFGDSIVSFHQWYIREREVKEKLETLGEDHKVIINKLETLLERVPSNAIVFPATTATILINNYPFDEEMRISQLFMRLFNNELEKVPELEGAIPENILHDIQSAIRNAMKIFLSEGDQITRALQGCVAFQIECKSFASLIRLFEKSASGELTMAMKPVEKEMRRVKGFERVDLQMVMYDDDFWSCMNKIVDSLMELYPFDEQVRNKIKSSDVVVRSGKDIELQLVIQSASEEDSERLKASIQEPEGCVKTMKHLIRSKLDIPGLDMIGSIVDGFETDSVASGTTKVTGPPGGSYEPPEKKYKVGHSVTTVGVQTKQPIQLPRRGVISGLTMLSPNKLVVVIGSCKDAVRLVDVISGEVTDQMDLDSRPWDVVSIPDNRLAVTLPLVNKIQFVSAAKALSTLGSIETDDRCRGIAYGRSNLVVSYSGKVEIITMKGDLVFSSHSSPDLNLSQRIEFVGVSKDEAFVIISDMSNHAVVLMNWEGMAVRRYKDDTIMPWGIAPSMDLTFYVCDYDNDTVHRMGSDGMKIQTIVTKDHGICKPRAIAYCENNKTIYVSNGMRGESISVLKLQ